MRSTRIRARMAATIFGLGLAVAGAVTPAVAAPAPVGDAPDRAQERAQDRAQVSPKVLASARSAVDSAVRRSPLTGIAWYADQATGKVVVTLDSTVSESALGKVIEAVGVDTDLLSIRRTKGEFRPLLGPGDAVYGAGYRCSLGFNVRSGGTYYFLTAGHCGDRAQTWYTNSRESTRIGPTAKSSFPGNDYALVRYDNTSLTHSGGYSVGDAHVGQRVTRDGSSSGTHSGTVKALNVSVKYKGSGTVRGMIQTNICAESGDSGGPLYDGSTALGITSGGSGDCSSGGTTFFQPVREALDAYGVNLY